MAGKRPIFSQPALFIDVPMFCMGPPVLYGHFWLIQGRQQLSSDDISPLTTRDVNIVNIHFGAPKWMLIKVPVPHRGDVGEDEDARRPE